MISINDKAELLGELVDVVEDMLEERGVTLPTPEIDADEIDEDNPTIIRGSDYDEMSGGFREVLERWKVVESEDNPEKEYCLEGYIPSEEIFQPLMFSKDLKAIQKAGDDLWHNVLDPDRGFQDLIQALVITETRSGVPELIFEENEAGICRWTRYDATKKGDQNENS